MNAGDDSATPAAGSELTGPLLLFDGECGLCNAVVRFLLRRDRTARLRFAPLQGRAGQATLRRLGLPTTDFDSIVFLPDATGAAYRLRSDGVVAVLQELPGPGGWVRVGRWLAVVPAPVRDFGYTLVARTRYALFGAYDAKANTGANAERRAAEAEGRILE